MGATKFIVKVDDITNCDELLHLRAIGASCLGVVIRKDSTEDEIARIVGSDRSDVCFRLDVREIGEDRVTDLCYRFRPWGVDFRGHFIPTKPTRDELSSHGFQLVFSGIDATYDTDPSWILSRYEELWGVEHTFFQINLFEEIDGSWRMLRDDVSEQLGELTISDINCLARQHRLILNLDFSADNISEIVNTFPNIAGIEFSLDETAFHRSHSLEEIESVLQAIK